MLQSFRLTFAFCSPYNLAMMEHIVDIIREQLEEDRFVRRHEAEILQLYAERSGLIRKKSPGSVRWNDEAAVAMSKTTRTS